MIPFRRAQMAYSEETTRNSFTADQIHTSHAATICPTLEIRWPVKLHLSPALRTPPRGCVSVEDGTKSLPDVLDGTDYMKPRMLEVRNRKEHNRVVHDAGRGS